MIALFGGIQDQGRQPLTLAGEGERWWHLDIYVAGGVVVITVGAGAEIEMKEKKARVDKDSPQVRYKGGQWQDAGGDSIQSWVKVSHC